MAEWRDNAKCRDVDPELFFPLTASGPSEFQTTRAIGVCSGCAVRAECLEWSLDNEVIHGVWGGLSERDRHDLLRTRRRRLSHVASSAEAFSA